jgi:hypothetical protein
VSYLVIIAEKSKGDKNKENSLLDQFSNKLKDSGVALNLVKLQLHGDNHPTNTYKDTEGEQIK